MLGASIGVMKICKEAAQIAPVPFLKGAVGTTLVLLETTRVRFNFSDKTVGN
jgi:hypothetical protein